ncbi:ATP-binding protein [Kitasatospora sp. NPDC087315]|uniref:ATP-binding protein n=1 Tax=Kitasatospora sp. NPDC087315 TaxID=3364069 RepID=UPI003803BC79
MTATAEAPIQAAPSEPLTSFTAEYPYAPESAKLARWLVDAALASWGLFDLIDNAVLVANELMSNAIATGCQRKIGFSIERLGESLIKVEVSDGSCFLPVFVDADLPADANHTPTRGRGLLVVNSLSHRWGLDLHARGKVVWAELRLGRRPSQY